MDKRSKERMKRANKRSRSIANEDKDRSPSNASDGGRSRGRMIGTMDDGPPPMAQYQDLTKDEIDSIDKRLNVLDELLNTEKDYLSDLQSVVDLYIEPMRTEALVPTEIMNKIFSNIEDLRDLHQSVYDQLHEKISDIQYMQCIERSISDIFHKSASRFEGYIQYSQNYSRSITCIKEMSTKHSTFQQFLERKQEEDPQGLRLIDYLIKPIQRLCKYPLLFRELGKCTSDGHKDKPFMMETMKVLQDLTTHVNECNERAELLEKLKEVESVIGHTPEPLAVPGRALLLSLPVMVAAEKSRERPGKLYICSDLVILAKIRPKKMEVLEWLSPAMALVDMNVLPAKSKNLKRKSTLSRSASMLSSSSSSNMVAADPTRCFTFISVAGMKKYVIQCSTAATVHQVETAMAKAQETIKKVEAVGLPLEEQLSVEKNARKELQMRNVELLNRIAELEAQLEAEVEKRKAAEGRLRKKASSAT